MKYYFTCFLVGLGLGLLSSDFLRMFLEAIAPVEQVAPPTAGLDIREIQQ